MRPFFATSKTSQYTLLQNLTWFNSSHTTVLFAIIFVFMFTVYATSDKIGSISKMHELLVKAAATNPVSGNAGGSYLTMRSLNGLIFGVINVRLFISSST